MIFKKTVAWLQGYHAIWKTAVWLQEVTRFEKLLCDFKNCHMISERSYDFRFVTRFKKTHCFMTLGLSHDFRDCYVISRTVTWFKWLHDFRTVTWSENCCMISRTVALISVVWHDFKTVTGLLLPLTRDMSWTQMLQAEQTVCHSDLHTSKQKS